MEAMAERARFRALQAAFAADYPRLLADPKVPRELFRATIAVLDRETGNCSWQGPADRGAG
jgi:hypothetical protein